VKRTITFLAALGILASLSVLSACTGRSSRMERAPGATPTEPKQTQPAPEEKRPDAGQSPAGSEEPFLKPDPNEPATPSTPGTQKPGSDTNPDVNQPNPNTPGNEDQAPPPSPPVKGAIRQF